MILTDRGERPIEQLTPGDLVWTRDGLQPVVACGKTGEEQVFKVELSNGRSLIGTGNHPVWTENRGFSDLSSLTPCDRLLAWQHQYPKSEVRPCQQNKFEAECISAIPAQKLSCSTGESITATPTPRKSDGDISGAGENMEMARRLRFTLPFGSIITGLFQRGIRYITRTVTGFITTFPISYVLPLQSTARFTKTADTWKATGTKSSIPMFASSVGQSIRPSEKLRQSIAGKLAKRSTCETTSSITRSGCALSVNQSTLLTSIENHKPAQGHVDRVYVKAVRRVAGKHAVYNLSVAETPEYFAQGVLVHNCLADGLVWVASVNFGDHFDSGHNRKNINVMNVKEDDVARESFAWRRAQYLRSMNKNKQKSTW